MFYRSLGIILVVTCALVGSRAATAGCGTCDKTVVENAVNNESFSTLVAAVKAAGLVETLSGSGPFTVFAPTDAAFEKLIDFRSEEYKNIILGDKTLLQYILLQHVTPELLRSGDLSSGMRIQTLAENSLTVLNTRDGLTM